MGNKKEDSKKRNENYRPLSAYHTYFSEIYEKLREEYKKLSQKEIHEKAFLKWKNLPSGEKIRYEKTAAEEYGNWIKELENIQIPVVEKKIKKAKKQRKIPKKNKKKKL